MQGQILKILLAFFEGFVLILSPCILPILPLILTGSVHDGRSKPIGIIIGFIVAFTLATLFSKWLVDLAHLNPNTLRITSYSLLIALGIVMMSDFLSNKFNYIVERIIPYQLTSQSSTKLGRGLLSGVLFGMLIGIIWTPCVGPILAAVIVQTVVASTTLESFLIVLAFAIGVALPMLLITLLGKKIMEKVSFFRAQAGLIRKFLGLLIILSVLLLIYSPNLFLYSSTQVPPNKGTTLTFQAKYKAPPIIGTAWINSPPLTMNDLKNKVVLVDFWTYSCINCIRTIPYLEEWYKKYHDKGFLIIGVHSPEFIFEHDLNNVKNAVKSYGITYPVVLDNNFETWQNYRNQYWPAHFLINISGEVVYQHFGEGDYVGMENAIRKLLSLPPINPTTKETVEQSVNQSPEMYFGYARANQFASPEIVTSDQASEYSYPAHLALNSWALKGIWIILSRKIIAPNPGASLKLYFHAKKVYAVMGALHQPVRVKVLLNGKPLYQNNGVDVINGQAVVSNSRLYHLVNLKTDSDGVLELITNDPSLVMYTFTFGS